MKVCIASRSEKEDGIEKHVSASLEVRDAQGIAGIVELGQTRRSSSNSSIVKACGRRAGCAACKSELIRVRSLEAGAASCTGVCSYGLDSPADRLTG